MCSIHTHVRHILHILSEKQKVKNNMDSIILQISIHCLLDQLCL